jgi:hypothetical protein
MASAALIASRTELRPLIAAEFSVLVEVLHRPQDLTCVPNAPSAEKLLGTLINHIKDLRFENGDALCATLLSTLEKMIMPAAFTAQGKLTECGS